MPGPLGCGPGFRPIGPFGTGEGPARKVRERVIPNPISQAASAWSQRGGSDIPNRRRGQVIDKETISFNLMIAFGVRRGASGDVVRPSGPIRDRKSTRL